MSYHTNSSETAPSSQTNYLMNDGCYGDLNARWMLFLDKETT